MSDRDLAEAIHHEILSADSITDALAVWRYEADEPSERQRMWLILEHVAAAAIDRALARRQREAARTGPWGEP